MIRMIRDGMGPTATYATVPCAVGRRHAFAFHEAQPPSPPQPRLLDRVRAAARLRHYSRRTEAAYVAWVRRYVVFHGKRHPRELGATEVTQFLSALAVEGRVAASTQALLGSRVPSTRCWEHDQDRSKATRAMRRDIRRARPRDIAG
jgi:hypothetical protein